MSHPNHLFRQVHPVHLQQRLSSAAFRPTPNDRDQLSVDCGNLTTAQAAYELHRQKTKLTPTGEVVPLETAGTWAFTRDDCQSLGLTVNPDPIDEAGGQPANPAHHLVDFSSIKGNPAKKNETAAKRLRASAEKIGRLWPKD